MNEKERHKLLESLDHDIWINLLHHGSYDSIGREVVKGLLSAKVTKQFSRKIIICGS